MKKPKLCRSWIVCADHGCGRVVCRELAGHEGRHARPGFFCHSWPRSHWTWAPKRGKVLLARELRLPVILEPKAILCRKSAR